LLQKLECEAGEVVGLEQIVGAQHAAGEVGHVHTDERVYFSSVAANLEGTGVCEVAEGDVSKDVRGFVWCVGWATVLGASQLACEIGERRRAHPVLRHALLSRQPFQAIRPLFDTKERAEVVLVEIATGNLLAVVAHKL
jgi:hypothetical protein